MILFIYSTSMYYHVEKDIYNELAHYTLETLFYISTIFFIVLIIYKMYSSINSQIFITMLFLLLVVYLKAKYDFISLEDEEKTIKLTVEAKPSTVREAVTGTASLLGFSYVAGKSVETIGKLAIETMGKPAGTRFPGYMGIFFTTGIAATSSYLGYRKSTYLYDLKYPKKDFNFNLDPKKASFIGENNASITELMSDLDASDYLIISTRLNVNITIYCIVCLILIYAIEKKKLFVNSIKPKFIRYLAEKIYNRYQNNKNILYIFMLVNQLMLLFSLIMVLPLLLN